MKPVKTFSESDQSPEFLLWGQNNWAFWGSNENKKQDWCESGKLINKMVENLNFDSFGGPECPTYLGHCGLHFTYLQN